MFRMMHVIDVDIDRHGVLVMRIDVKLRRLVAMMERLMVAVTGSVSERESDGMDVMGVSVDWDHIHIMLSVSV